MVRAGWSNDALDEDPSLIGSDAGRAEYNRTQERERQEREAGYGRQRRRDPNAAWVREAIRNRGI